MREEVTSDQERALTAPENRIHVSLMQSSAFLLSAPMDSRVWVYNCESVEWGGGSTWNAHHHRNGRFRAPYISREGESARYLAKHRARHRLLRDALRQLEMTLQSVAEDHEMREEVREELAREALAKVRAIRERFAP